MQMLLTGAIGILLASAFYSLMRRGIAGIAVALLLVSHAVNLLIFNANELSRGAAPIVAEGAQTPPVPFADPLPQALILTAIVISFGMYAFTLVLVYRAREAVGTEAADALDAANGEAK